MDINTLEVSFTSTTTESFNNYQKTGNENDWIKDNCSVFIVKAEESDSKLPKTEFTLTGYEILKAFSDVDIDLRTINPDDLWDMILVSSYNLLESHL